MLCSGACASLDPHHAIYILGEPQETCTGSRASLCSLASAPGPSRVRTGEGKGRRGCVLWSRDCHVYLVLLPVVVVACLLCGWLLLRRRVGLLGLCLRLPACFLVRPNLAWRSGGCLPKAGPDGHYTCPLLLEPMTNELQHGFLLHAGRVQGVWVSPSLRRWFRKRPPIQL